MSCYTLSPRRIPTSVPTVVLARCADAFCSCLLASWVGRFSFELDNKEMMDEEKLDIKGGITARPAKGMHVRATVLDGW